MKSALTVNPETGLLYDQTTNLVYADQAYQYALTGSLADDPNGQAVSTDSLVDRQLESSGAGWRITGRFARLGIKLDHLIEPSADGLAETISLTNTTNTVVSLTQIAFGFAASLAERGSWRLTALPFFIQLDGSRHDYSAENLMAGEFSNASYHDGSLSEPELADAGRLRSEAWAWGDGVRGIVVAKYNPTAVEMSVASADDGSLRFGGVGSSLYTEPAAGHTLAPNSTFIYGSTHYIPFDGGLVAAARTYRSFLEARGHGFPSDYNPPVNWNVLYDIGWFHSDPVKLSERYTRDALLEEAVKARACGCDLLYLDPGWEVVEGTTLWAEDRIGTVSSLANTLESDYGLTLGFRTILRCYRDLWPQSYLIMRADGTRSLSDYGHQGSEHWDPCLCYAEYFAEKLERISTIVEQGRVKFLMVDEMAWRGPCHDPAHGHAVPTTHANHLDSVYNLCRALRNRFPDLLIECHDPVWPWHTSIYAPTYYAQGFDSGSYQETWGFEYMWDTLNDLKSGKALALYAYNLACNIPLYLHITMNSDNENAVFFWWAASTVRHLGVGGKYGHESVGKVENDPEARFAKYCESMTLYKKLKAYFVRGTFHGLSETAHLHTLPGISGGVLLLFNLTEQDQDVTCDIPLSLVAALPDIAVVGAKSSIDGGILRISARLAALSPLVVRLGEAASPG